MSRIGIISDTHGQLPESVFEAFEGVDHVIHAGDVCGDDVLVLLEAIAPVTAVRGNMDDSGEGAGLPARATLTVDGVAIVVQHGPFGGGVDVAVREAGVLVHGHTHRPYVRRAGGSLVVNPGSPVANRDRGEGTVALLTTGDGPPRAALVPLRG